MPIYESHTYIAIPPGETLKETLENWDISLKEFGTRMGISPDEVEVLINGDIALTPEIAARIDQALPELTDFGKFLLGLEEDYRENIIRVDAENALDAMRTWRQPELAMS